MFLLGKRRNAGVEGISFLRYWYILGYVKSGTSVKVLLFLLVSTVLLG